MSSSEWELVYPAPPWLMNQDNLMHHLARHRRRTEWKEAFWALAKAAKMPTGLDHVMIRITHRYTSKRPPDCDACAPAAKAAIDGLVLAKVVADDSPTYVGPITYEIPVRSGHDALELVVTAI